MLNFVSISTGELTLEQTEISEAELTTKPIWAEIMRAAVTVARQSLLSEHDLLQAVGRELRRLKLNGALLLLTPEGRLRVEATSSSIENTLKKLTGRDVSGHEFEPGDVDVYREILSTKKPIYTHDRQAVLHQITPESLQPFLGRIANILGEQPLIYTPLLIGKIPLGVMNVSADWLTVDDIPMVRSLGDHIAIALDQIRTNVEMKLVLERERLRLQIAEVAASSRKLPEILDQVLSLVGNATGANAGAIALIEPKGETLRFHNLFGLPEHLRNALIPRNKGLTWQLIETRQAMSVSDYSSQPNALPQWIKVGINAVIGAPLITGDRVIGAIGLFIKGSKGEFSQEHLDRLVTASQMAAGVIYNAQLFNQATKHAEEAEALRRGAIAVSSSLDYETVLSEIAQQAKEILRADGSRIHILDTDQNVLRCMVALHPHAEEVMGLELQPGEGLAGHVLKSGEPLLVNQPVEHPHSVQVPGTPEDEAEVLALAPLIRRQRTIGVMTVRRDSYEHPFSAANLKLLSAFASQAAVAIENALLYGQIEAQAQQLEDTVAARTRELFLSEARYRSLVETSLTGIYQLDNQAKVNYVNEQFARMIELPPEELVGRSVADFLAPEHRSMAIDRAQSRMRGEGPPTDVYELELLSWGGRRIPVIVAVSLITNDEGNPEGVSGLVLDISQRKTLEAALRTERDRLGAILSNVGDAVLVTSREGVIEFINPAWERLNGYSSDEALGQNPNLVRSGQHSDKFYKDLWETVLTGRVWNGEVVNRRKDGTNYEAALTITPVIDEEGTIVNFVGVQHDISMLKEIDRLKSQFVSDVSHELRTPLTNIRLYLDLIQQTEYDQRAARYMETLSRESERLSTLIEDLLSLSRLEADSVPIAAKPVNINRLLSALAEDRERLAAQHGLDLRIECEAKLPNAIGDENLLSQVFTNLLTNALNYTSEGGQIILRTESESNNLGKWVIAQFEDTGHGIPPHEQALIFRRFFRGEASKPTNVAGTGLGLSICKKIAERHGGKITVESIGIPGKGSIFSVWLPAED
jgi:PAS domain S-box-containing protein